MSSAHDGSFISLLRLTEAEEGHMSFIPSSFHISNVRVLHVIVRSTEGHGCFNKKRLSSYPVINWLSMFSMEQGMHASMLLLRTLSTLLRSSRVLLAWKNPRSVIPIPRFSTSL